MTKVTVRLDKRALDEVLLSRNSPVARVLSSFAGQATQEIKGVFKQRAGGPWWPVSTSIAQAASRGITLTTVIKSTRPHRINAKVAPYLSFKLSDGRRFVGYSVNHPGSSPPVALVLEGIERAGRRITFTAAAPVVSNVT